MQINMTFNKSTYVNSYSSSKLQKYTYHFFAVSKKKFIDLVFLPQYSLRWLPRHHSDPGQANPCLGNKDTGAQSSRENIVKEQFRSGWYWIQQNFSSVYLVVFFFKCKYKFKCSLTGEPSSIIQLPLLLSLMISV